MRRSAFFFMLAAFLLVTGCAGQSSTANTPPTTTPSVSPTPTLPNGDYAFIRNGDIWAHTGNGPAHALTQLHLSAVSALWGSMIWSPDHMTLAFVLNAPPFAAGFTALNPAQDTGTLFTVNVASDKLSVVDTSGAATVPLMGQHVAWLHNSDATNTLLFTHNGAVEQFTANTTGPSVLAGPQNVWEIAVRGTTLFYSTLTHIVSTTGAGMAELHSFDLTTHKDVFITKLGAATLPSLLCGGVICPPDPSTPAVPYAWAASADGSLIAYQTTISPASNPTPTPAPSRIPSPTPTHAAALVALVPATTPPPAFPNSFYVAQRDGSKAQVIFADVPALPGLVALAFSPDGRNLALSVTTPNAAPYGPFVQPVGATGTAQTYPATNTAYAGNPSWSPDSQGFSLTAYVSGTSAPTLGITTFLLDGQDAMLEQNGAQLVWGQ